MRFENSSLPSILHRPVKQGPLSALCKGRAQVRVHRVQVQRPRQFSAAEARKACAIELVRKYKKRMLDGCRLASRSVSLE